MLLALSFLCAFCLLNPSLLFICALSLALLSLPLSHSLTHSPPFNDLDWSVLMPGNTCTQASTQCERVLHASELFLSMDPFRALWSWTDTYFCWSVLLQTRQIPLEQNKQVRLFFPLDPPDCGWGGRLLLAFLGSCATGNDKGILLSWKLTSGLFWLLLVFTLRYSTGTARYLPTSHFIVTELPPSYSIAPSRSASFPFFNRELSSPVHRRHLFLFCHSTRSLTNLLHLSFISVLPSTPPPQPTLNPSHFTTSTPLHLLLEGHLPQSMGPPPLSPPPCPLPCLCSEAVCCGSTNGRVRRKPYTSHGYACQSQAKGSRGGVVCFSSGMCS